MPEPNHQTLYTACCRGCSKMITLGPDNTKCPHCGKDNKVLEWDGVKVEDLPKKLGS